MRDEELVAHLIDIALSGDGLSHKLIQAGILKGIRPGEPQLEITGRSLEVHCFVLGLASGGVQFLNYAALDRHVYYGTPFRSPSRIDLAGSVPPDAAGLQDDSVEVGAIAWNVEG